MEMNKEKTTPWRTRAVEDFLRTVYTLQQTTVPVLTTQISRDMHIAAPSVTDMIQRLAAGHVMAEPPRPFVPPTPLLDYVPYCGVRLTAAGEQIALQVLRRRRLLELYLVQRLGYTWNEVEAEADRLEHDVSEQLTERLAASLGSPMVDPHGDPIPGTQDSLLKGACAQAVDDFPLTRVAPRRHKQTSSSTPEDIR